ncbi:DHH family phosphoesterase [Nanoarchaeota archaeon]
MLTKKEVKQLREELETATRPLFIFDDDPDGLCSFLLFYRFIREGKGVIKKSTPKISMAFVRKVEEYKPDKVFVLDVPIVEQDFIDAIKEPIIWVDHHGPYDRHGLLYFNPRKHDAQIYYPVTKICYDVVQQDLWIAMCGCIGDWFVPDFKDEFCEKYPKLLDKKETEPGKILFETRLGKLVKVFSFNLKGKASEVMKAVKVLTRIEDPEEILSETTPQGKFIMKRFKRVNSYYEDLKKQAKARLNKSKILLFPYTERQWSLSRDLATELVHEHPDKIVIVGRVKGGEMKCSIRSREAILPPIVEKSLRGLEGYGGGHDYACGAVIKEEDFDQFIKNFKAELK